MTLNQTLTKADHVLRKTIFCAYAEKMAEQIRRTEAGITKTKDELSEIEDDAQGNKDPGEVGSIINQKLKIGIKLEALSDKLTSLKKILVDAVLAHSCNKEVTTWRIVRVRYKKHPVSNRETFFIVPCNGTLDIDLKIDGVTIISAVAPLARTLLNEDGDTDFDRIHMSKRISGEIISII